MKGLIYKLTENSRERSGADAVKRQVFVAEQGIATAAVFGNSGNGEELNMVVKDGETVIGTARVIFPAANTAKIERMAVLKNFRHQGIGRDIMAFLRGELKRRQIKRAYLHAQHTVIDFYKACGFHETGEPFFEVGINHVRMEAEY